MGENCPDHNAATDVASTHPSTPACLLSCKCALSSSGTSSLSRINTELKASPKHQLISSKRRSSPEKRLAYVYTLTDNSVDDVDAILSFDPWAPVYYGSGLDSSNGHKWRESTKIEFHALMKIERRRCCNIRIARSLCLEWVHKIKDATRAHLSFQIPSCCKGIPSAVSCRIR